VLIDQQQRFQRALDVAIAAGHDFVDGGFIWSKSHRRILQLSLDKYSAPAPRSCGLRGKGQAKTAWMERARPVAAVADVDKYKVTDDGDMKARAI